MVKVSMSPTPTELSKDVESLNKRILDLRPVWPKIERRIQNSIRQAQASKGATIGAKWPPYKPSYAKRVGSPIPTLRRSGSMIAEATGRAASTLRKPLLLLYRVRGDILPIHEHGSKKHNIARRPMVGVSKQAESQSLMDIQKHTDNQISLFESGRAMGSL